MKKNKLVFLAIFMGCLFVMAQRHEIGVQFGASNLVGDIGTTSYINPFPSKRGGYNISNEGIPFYAAFMYRMNFNPYQSLRFRIAYNHMTFNDKYAQEYYRQNRGYYGTNSMYEASAIFDYNFLPVNDEQKNMISPYIFGGISGIMFSATQAVFVNDFNRDVLGNAIAPSYDEDFNTTLTFGQTGQKFSLAIPFGVGLKYKFNYNWSVFGEFMFRPTITDAIDNSVIEKSNVKITYNKDILAGANSNKSLLQTDPYLTVAKERADEYLKAREIGNTNSKDWVNTISIGISYSFGRPPCYCED